MDLYRRLAVAAACLAGSMLPGRDTAGASASLAGDAAPVSAVRSRAAAYFGVKPPGEVPEPFAPEILSRFGFVARIAFSPDGAECLFTVTDATYTHPRLFYTRLEDGAWTEPAVPAFADVKWINHEPFFSADGRSVYFTSDRATSGATNRRDLWVVERKADGWSTPERLPAPINSDHTEFFLSQAADGTLYFASDRPGGVGKLDLYRARVAAGQPPQVENLGSPVNTEGWDGDPCISPDQGFLVFPSGPTGADLYVSFRDAKGRWSKPVDLGEGFNTAAAEYAPSLSPDGQFLFFARHDGRSCRLFWVRTIVLQRYR